MYRKVTSFQVEEFVRMETQRRGYGPSVREVARKFEVSETTIRNHLLGLTEDGKVKLRNINSRQRVIEPVFGK